MKLRSFLDSQSGFRYIVERLSLSSSYSRQVVMDTPFTSTIKDIKAGYEDLSMFYRQFIEKGKFQFTILAIQEKLSLVKDIRGSISRLERGIILDDVELFEIKSLALVSEDIRHIFIETGLNIEYLNLCDLSSVLDILDPEGNRINSFYVYEAYSEELSRIRKELKSLEVFNEDLHYRASIIEEKVRKELCGRLNVDVKTIRNALSALTNLDIIIAKALQIKELKLTFPVISKKELSYTGLFNPEVSDNISNDGRDFQSIDILVENYKPLLITGANMGGKSVTLKTLALSQLLFHFSFGIPATSASISAVNDVFLISGDYQDISKGLSSFASEMIKIDEVIKVISSGKRVLALIDEPAGTTNPSEGTALVSALLHRLTDKDSFIVITTHYNVDNIDCKRLRVKGYCEGKMDYSLVAAESNEAPREAIKIARSLKIDESWINEAEYIVNQR
ncbi:MAG: hypothetical protein M0R37_02210 [Bacteroidales bacterium]|nr:hypothetical protein [Bacteroidales bacterium]